MTLEELEIHRAAAEQIARKTGEMLRHTTSFSVSEKHENDYVTDADKAAEDMIVSYLSRLFPYEGFHGEEGGDRGRTFPRWIIDPIDGTMNFMRGMPNFTISIGFEEEYGKPVMGVVYNVMQDEMFSGIVGNGAFLNGREIRVSDIKDPGKGIIICEAPHRRKEWCASYYSLFEDIFVQMSDLRCYGSIALELCYIASGRVDAVFEYNLGYWDVAAGLAILKAAGGDYDTVTDGKPIADEPVDFIATNSHLQAWLTKKVRGFGDIRLR